MVRLFGHHVALPVMLLVLCDVFLFLSSLLLALWTYPAFALASFPSDIIHAPLVVALAAINLVCLFAAGLYKRDAITISGKISEHMVTAVSLIIVAFAAYLVPYSMVQGHRFSNIYALAILAVCFQLVLLFCVRAIFVNAFAIIGFKRRILLFGHDALASKVEGWLAEHDPGYTDIVHYSALRPEQVVPIRWRSAELHICDRPAPAGCRR